MGKGCAALGLALVMVGCHHAATMPLLAVGPVRPGDASVFDDAMRAARDSGHPPVRTDPEHGRFAVRANADAARHTYFVIECSQDGYVTLVPQGGSVSRVGDAFLLEPSIRTEYAELAVALERGIPEQP